MEKIIQLPDYLSPSLAGLILIGASICSGIIIKIIVIKVLEAYARRSGSFFLNAFIRHLSYPLNFFIPLLLLNIFLPLNEGDRDTYRVVSRIAQIALALSFSWLLIRFVNVLEDLIYRQFEEEKGDSYRERKVKTQLQFIKRLVVIAIVIFTISIVLLSFENVRRLGAGLLTGAGVAGIIIGFAAQKSLTNLLAGFQIAFTQPFRIGDVLVVENENGRVEEITLTYVVLRLWDNRRLILPITYFIEKPFQNWTRTSSDLLGTVLIYTDYNIPVDAVRKELNRLLKENPLWNGKVAALQVTNANEQSIELRALMSARDSGSAFDLRCNIREQLVAYITKNYPGSFPKTRTESKEIPPDVEG